MEFKDYYQVLGVARDAAEADIKKAYRRLVRQHHPDVSKAAGAEARMQDINEAWEVLQDAERRAAYDRLGQRWQGGAEFQPPPDWDTGSEFAGAPDNWSGDAAEHSAFFDALFGAAHRAGHRGAGQHRHPAEAGFAARGGDQHARISVSLEDAFRGAERTLSLQGATRDGHGRSALHERQLSVLIPLGIRAGQQIRLAGQGSPGLGGGPPGDLFLELQFEPHARYRIDGRDLYLNLPLAPWEAALGVTLPLATPGGALEVSVPAQSQPGRKLRLKGRGIPAPAAGGTPGDLYLVLDVVLPPADTEQARSAYQRMAKDLAFDPRQGWEG
jgi:curved DNA-binding protein